MAEGSGDKTQKREKEPINVGEFLKRNKLSHVEDTFNKRNISIEEIVEFGESDLKLCNVHSNLNT